MSKNEQNRTTIKKAAMVEAMRTTLGNVTESCKVVGIGRVSYYDWMNNDSDFKEQIDAVQEIIFDFVESEIIKQIKEGNTAVIIFYAKTRMKSRGFVERQEIELSDKPAFIISPEQKGVIKVMELIRNSNGNKIEKI